MRRESRESVASPRLLLAVWLALMLLLALTAVSAQFAMGHLNVVVNIGISVGKTFLVMAFFMHLHVRGGLLRSVAVAGVVWLLLLLGLSLTDYLTRVTVSPPW